jgi:hypothetical protein
MHQTFYIDVDEEISSVIDRLKKSMAVDNYFVAPKRAIFLQSIVNLKLLKREAEKMKKRVILVTQEKLVSAMAARSGVDVRSSIEGLDEVLDDELEEDYEDIEMDKSPIVAKQGNEKSLRLKNVGSDDFFDTQTYVEVNRYKKSSSGKETKDVRQKSETVSSVVAGSNNGKKVPVKGHLSSGGSMSGIVTGDKSKFRDVRKPTERSYVGRNEGISRLDSKKEATLEKMFVKKEQKFSNNDRQISNSKTKNFFFVFIIICLFLLAGVAGYLYIPSASIVLKPSAQTIRIDEDAVAIQSQQSDNAIPVHVINHEEQLTLQYDATGKSSSSGKKAQGTVVIYNEFENQPQTLVATTRLETDGGKVFRLLKTTVVPAMSNVGGQSKPGAISAEIVADQPGVEYNIEATNFKIPGFKGGPKYDKFYAKSSVTINGGTSDGDAASGVSQADLDNAKQKTETAIREKITAIIKSEMNTDEIDLPAAEKITQEKSFSNAKVGDKVDSFEYTVTASVHVLVFSQKDIKDILKKNSQYKEQAKKDVTEIFKKIEYVSAEPDFDNNKLTLKIHGEVEMVSNVDTESFKKEVLGKNESELTAILKKHPSIENANLVFFPTFINHVPQFSRRVSVEVEKVQ